MNVRRTPQHDRPAEAAALYLDQAAQAGGHRALILVDSDGLLIVQNTTALDVESLAAISPLATRYTEERRGLLDLITRGEALHVWAIEMDGDPYFITAVGGVDTVPKDAESILSHILMRPLLQAA